VVIRDFNPEKGLASEFNEASETIDSKVGAMTPTYEPVSKSGGWWTNVTVTPENKTGDYSIFVPSGPFKGLALGPDQKSAKSITHRTGPIMFPVLLYSIDDKSQSGMNFIWALVHKILTEDQKVLEIEAKDIMLANTGEIIKRKPVVSKLLFDVEISQGASKGTIISPGKLVKIDFFLGWNIIPIQYKDSNGLPAEAILILLVNDLRQPILAREKNNRENIEVKEKDIIFQNYSR
jgi:hypothetical protein